MDNILVLVSGAVSGLFGWFVARRRSDVETDNLVLKNLQESILLYKSIIDDLKTEITQLNNKIQELEDKIDVLHNENIKLKKLL
jgi:predicted  nucleic acid-binding Zn-ribbon protein